MTLLASGIILFRLLEGVPHLLLLRHSQGKHWGFAKGRRDPADAHEIATARREVEEETGYTDVKLNPMFRSLLHYSVRDEIGDSIPKRVAYFLGPAPERDPALSEEHNAFCWATEEEAEKLLGPENLQALAKAAFLQIAGETP